MNYEARKRASELLGGAVTGFEFGGKIRRMDHLATVDAMLRFADERLEAAAQVCAQALWETAATLVRSFKSIPVAPSEQPSAAIHDFAAELDREWNEAIDAAAGEANRYEKACRKEAAELPQENAGERHGWLAEAGSAAIVAENIRAYKRRPKLPSLLSFVRSIAEGRSTTSAQNEAREILERMETDG